MEIATVKKNRAYLQNSGSRLPRSSRQSFATLPKRIGRHAGGIHRIPLAERQR
jgi:hypothetical protein